MMSMGRARMAAARVEKRRVSRRGFGFGVCGLRASMMILLFQKRLRVCSLAGTRGMVQGLREWGMMVALKTKCCLWA